MYNNEQGFTMVLVHLVIFFSCSVGLQIFVDAFFHATMSPCPEVQPFQIDIEKLTGKWHLVILTLDAATESYQARQQCVQVDLERHNATVYKQTWYIDAPFRGYGAKVELMTSEEMRGRWKVTSPLGGVMQATILSARPEEHLAVSFCGERAGIMTHLWTAVATRNKAPASVRFLELAQLLFQHGFRPETNRLITWEQCKQHDTDNKFMPF